MKYRKYTPFFKIPVICADQTVSEQEEWRKYNIIENQLLAGTKGVKCCVFEDGHYRIVDNVDGTFTVMLVGTGQHVALEGILNGGYCFSKNPVLWENLRGGRIYHLYVSYTKKLYEDETAFGIIAKEATPYSYEIPTYLYLAKFDATGGKPVVDSFPDGKVYANDIAVHANDTTNPHGTHQVQDQLTIRNQLQFGERLLLNENGSGELNDVLQRKFLAAQTTSGGKEGRKIDLPKSVTKILNVSVNEMCWEGQGPIFSLGEVAINYNPALFTVYNGGVAGLPIYVAIWYE